MNATEDTLKHIDAVRVLLWHFGDLLSDRSNHHDASKLEPPEKEMYEIFRPKLDSLNIESDEYKAALKEMGTALQHHYTANRHHPEHFENGVSGMTLVDVVEMVCDWKAAAGRKGEAVNLEWARKRFGIDPQLLTIIANTLEALK